MYVMGEPLCCAGMYTAPTSSPVALSYARSMAPRRPDGVLNVPLSPEMIKVFVTRTPGAPVRPVRGMSSPASAGWLRT